MLLQQDFNLNLIDLDFYGGACVLVGSINIILDCNPLPAFTGNSCWMQSMLGWRELRRGVGGLETTCLDHSRITWANLNLTRAYNNRKHTAMQSPSPPHNVKSTNTKTTLARSKPRDTQKVDITSTNIFFVNVGTYKK